MDEIQMTDFFFLSNNFAYKKKKNISQWTENVGEDIRRCPKQSTQCWLTAPQVKLISINN